MADRVAVVRQLADEVLERYDPKRIGTHYDGCWKVHMYCFARLLKDVTEGDQHE